MNEERLVPVSLVQHGISFEEQKINPNQWKQRTNSNDLREDFEDIFELRNSVKHAQNINQVINENLKNNSFKDTKRLLNSISNTSLNVPSSNKKNVFLNINTRNNEQNIENMYEPIELIEKTHKVTEKIKFLNLFDAEEPAAMNFIEHNEEEDDDVEMADLDELVNEDIIDDEAPSASSDIELLDSDSNKDNISMKTVLKSIVNPTELGIQFAQSVLEKEEQEEKQEDTPKQEEPIPAVETETETKHTENGQHITINNHYYNYFNINQPAHESYVADQPYKQKRLPNPWSAESAPMQKSVYNITTYFQLALNGSIYFLTILLVTIFIKTISHDLSNLFYQQKQDQLHQISKCTEMYEINKCYLGIPKMAEVCSSWQRCMMDNPDKKVVNKTRIYVNLLTGVLSEFLSTIGFLNSISLCMLLYSGYFTVNLLFGYIRGKSYGKEHTQLKVDKTPDVIELPSESEPLPVDYKKEPLVLTY